MMISLTGLWTDCWGTTRPGWEQAFILFWVNIVKNLGLLNLAHNQLFFTKSVSNPRVNSFVLSNVSKNVFARTFFLYINYFQKFGREKLFLNVKNLPPHSSNLERISSHGTESWFAQIPLICFQNKQWLSIFVKLCLFL